MIDLIPYKKGNNTETDTDFKEKKKYGEVYYAGNHVFVKKGLGWLYASLQGATAISLSRGTRQLRQCCGAPVYGTKSVIITFDNGENLYLSIEDTENGDFRYTEKLMNAILSVKHDMVIRD